MEATLEGRELSDVVTGDENGIVVVPENRSGPEYPEGTQGDGHIGERAW